MRKSWFEIDEEERAKEDKTVIQISAPTPVTIIKITSPSITKPPLQTQTRKKLPSDMPIRLDDNRIVYSPCTICYYSHHDVECDSECALCKCVGCHSSTCKLNENAQKLLISLNLTCTNLKLNMDDLPRDLQDLVNETKKYMKDNDIKSCLFPHICRVCSKFHEDACKSNCYTCHKRGYHLKNCSAKPSNVRLVECIVGRSTMLFGKVLKIAQDEIDLLSKK